MKLNKLQRKAADAVLTKKHQVIVLTGAGGTGKTYTVQYIIDHYSGNILLSATTNKAKEVLAVNCQTQAFTTQRARGFALVKVGYSQVLKKVKDSMEATLLIIDEVSMLPKRVYDDIMNEVTEDPNFQVLFLGDPIQLPAIGFGVKIDEIPGFHIELTKQQRQADADESLTNYLSALRKVIETKQYDNPPSYANVKGITIHTDHKSFCDTYLADDGNKKLTAYRNAVVNKYNLNIHGKDSLFNSGDEVVIDKPIYQGEVCHATNGDTVVVNAVSDSPFDKCIAVQVVTMTGYCTEIYYWETNSAKEEVLEQYKAVNDMNRYWAVEDKSMALKHLYACTVHKTQGSTYDTIYIDGTDLWSAHTALPNKYSKPIDLDLFYRLLYVAISRMTTHCHIFIGKIRNYSYLRR